MNTRMLLQAISRKLHERTQQNPSDLGAWFDLAELQVRMVHTDPTTPLSRAEESSVARMQMAVLDRAEEASGQNRGAMPLVLGRLLLAANVGLWTSEKLNRAWRNVLEEYVGRSDASLHEYCRMWWLYVHFRKSDWASFALDEMVGIFEEALAAPQQTMFAADLDDVHTFQVHIRGGMQSMREWETHFPMTDFISIMTKTRAVIQEQPDGEDILNNHDMVAWQQTELRAAEHASPRRFENDIPGMSIDPFSYVLFDDLRMVMIEPSPNALASTMRVADALLAYIGLPSHWFTASLLFGQSFLPVVDELRQRPEVWPDMEHFTVPSTMWSQEPWLQSDNAHPSFVQNVPLAPDTFFPRTSQDPRGPWFCVLPKLAMKTAQNAERILVHIEQRLGAAGQKDLASMIALPHAMELYALATMMEEKQLRIYTDLAEPLHSNTLQEHDFIPDEARAKDWIATRQFSNVTFIGAHDSYAVGPTTRFGANQELTVKDQLDSGIRALQIQGHKSSQGGSGISLCHTSCTILNGGTLENYLSNVTEWVKANPNDVISIFIANNDNLPATQWDKGFSSSGLKSYTYAPGGQKLAKKNWPTLQEMINNNQRVVVFMDYETDISNVNYILPEFKNVWENPYDQTKTPFNCTPDRIDGSASSMMYLTNHFLDEEKELFGQSFLTPSVDQLNTTNSANSILQDTNNCAQEHGSYPTFVLVDFFATGNGSVFKAAAKMNNIQFSGANISTSNTNADTEHHDAGYLTQPLAAYWAASAVLALLLGLA
ncbi:hypothetical protein MBRA1_001043 [Malassezia brasiliensis]|uniref:Uncharacterized protein n=1 Tax=Malassezia brasiliensis TaxID=1821822 RepID=A0AAF0IRZ2_9BASI|nr:hypothetical protein MBRA1_001043 [Malassezia brasiliensis]